jgi:YegS/Rv2252/BmrU family lipid kinase
VIANPRSGKGRGEEAGRRLCDRLRDRGHTVTLARTQAARHATELARGATASGHEIVAAVGGDGTVSECAEWLIGAECALALVPAGTGNDLARALGVPGDVEAAAAAIHAGRCRPLDAWRLNDRCFINVAGVGFDAEAAATLGPSGRRIGGTLVYVAGVLATLMRYRPRGVRLCVDEIEFAGRVMMVALANAPYYGGGMKVAPDADPTDGLLDVVVVQAVSKLHFLRQFPRVFRGTHVTDPAVKLFRGRTVTLDGDRTTPVMLDGEPYGTLPVRVALAGTPLRMIVP